MKSKSFTVKQSPVAGKLKHNRTFDFVGLYKSAAETGVKVPDNQKTGDHVNKENTFGLKTSDTSKADRSLNKKKKKNKNELDLSKIVIDGKNLGATLNAFPVAGTSSPVGGVNLTSTPKAAAKNQTPKVKSIMKNSSSIDSTMEDYSVNYTSHKPKKRNKSVSFMLEDNEEVVVKKTKSDESLKSDKKSKTKGKEIKEDVKKKFKNLKKNMQEEKENKANINMDIDPKIEGNKKSKIKTDKPINEPNDTIGDSAASSETQNQHEDKKKKFKKFKKKKIEEATDPTENDTNVNDEPTTETKMKKIKKKKRHAKSSLVQDTTETEGEPVIKNRKKDAKADVIAEDLENLTIGDNAHTLTNLLDDMTVVDKEKKKKNKVRRKKEKPDKTASVSSSETADLEKIEEGKEKIKWKKRKWNKDKKGDVEEENLLCSIVIENLPLKTLFAYKKMLTDHFVKHGLIKKIGVAEVYPTEEPKPVFTTSITFYSEGAANKALEEDNNLFEGSRIRIKRPLPPTQTTLVVRSYAELSEQNLSSVFSGAGRIRNIRHLVKGRKAMATAFIEFDGPETVERAIKMAEDAKIGAKKIHVSKFELRGSRKEKQPKNNVESENEGDSEDSND